MEPALFEHLYQLLCRHQHEEKARLYEDFEAREVVAFLLDYVYAPPGSGKPGDSMWTHRFHAVFLDYHDRILRVAANPLSVLKLGYGALFVETLGLMFDFYGLMNELDMDKLLILSGWLEHKQVVKLKALPMDLYGRAFVAADPAGQRHRELVNLADKLLESVNVVMNSAIAMGTIRAGLSVLGSVAPKRFKDIVPYAKLVVDKGKEVLKPHQDKVGVLRRDMLNREETYIGGILSRYGGIWEP